MFDNGFDIYIKVGSVFDGVYIWKVFCILYYLLMVLKKKKCVFLILKIEKRF